MREKAAFPKRRPQRRRFGGDFYMKNAAFSENVSWGRLDEKSRFSNRENARGWLFFENFKFFNFKYKFINSKFRKFRLKQRQPVTELALV